MPVTQTGVDTRPRVCYNSSMDTIKEPPNTFAESIVIRDEVTEQLFLIEFRLKKKYMLTDRQARKALKIAARDMFEHDANHSV